MPGDMPTLDAVPRKTYDALAESHAELVAALDTLLKEIEHKSIRTRANTKVCGCGCGDTWDGKAILATIDPAQATLTKARKL